MAVVSVVEVAVRLAASSLSQAVLGRIMERGRRRDPADPEAYLSGISRPAALVDEVAAENRFAVDATLQAALVDDEVEYPLARGAVSAIDETRPAFVLPPRRGWRARVVPGVHIPLVSPLVVS